MNPLGRQRPSGHLALGRPWPQRPGLALARALQGLSGLAWPGLLSENAHRSRTRALFSRNRFFDFGWLLARFPLQNPTKKGFQKTDRRGPFSALGCFGRLGSLWASPWPPFGLTLASLGPPWPLLGLPVASLGLPLASLWPSLAPPWPPFGLPWASLGISWAFLRLPLASLTSFGLPLSSLMII